MSKISPTRLMFVGVFAVLFVSVGHTIWNHFHPSPMTLCGFLWDAEGKNPHPLMVVVAPDLLIAQPDGGIVTLRTCAAGTSLESLQPSDYESMMGFMNAGNGGKAE